MVLTVSVILVHEVEPSSIACHVDVAASFAVEQIVILGGASNSVVSCTADEDIVICAAEHIVDAASSVAILRVLVAIVIDLAGLVRVWG